MKLDVLHVSCAVGVFIWVLLTMQRTGAKRFQTSELLESILSEVFMPCEQNVSNVTFYRSTKPPATVSNVNTTLQSEALNTTDHDSFVNEFGFCVPYEPGQGWCDNYLSADDYVFVPFERQSLRAIQQAVHRAFSLLNFILLLETECFKAARAMFCYHYFIPCTSSPGEPGLPRPLCLDECITVSVDRCAYWWDTAMEFVGTKPELQVLGLGLPDCCNLTEQIGPAHNCCQPLGEFQRDSLMPSYQSCFPELAAVAPTNSSAATFSFSEVDITGVVAGTASAAGVLTTLLVIALAVLIVFSISLRKKRKKLVPTGGYPNNIPCPGSHSGYPLGITSSIPVRRPRAPHNNVLTVNQVGPVPTISPETSQPRSNSLLLETERCTRVTLKAGNGPGDEATPSPVKMQVNASHLQLIKWKDERGNTHKFYLMENIQNKWRDIGQLLIHSENPHPQLEAISMEHRAIPLECCRDVLEKWLENPPDAYPATWDGLIEVLDDCKLPLVANKLKDAISKARLS